MKQSTGILVLAVLIWWLSAAVGQAGTLAQFRTPVGDIDVELFDQEKPVTVQNFIRHVNSSPAFTNFQFIHRWVPGFVIQGGGYFVTNRFGTNPQILAVPGFAAITNEFSVGPIYSNTYGTIAMARVGGQTNSATSEWFINLGNNSSLDNVDGGFTVFGRVVQGTNTLNKFLTYPNADISGWNIGSPFDELPTMFTETLTINSLYNVLLYVDISFLRVSVKILGGGAREIAWNSVSNRLNRVEYTTNYPPAWQSLVTTNGNGSRFTVTDTNLANVRAFYRIRVDY